MEKEKTVYVDYKDTIEYKHNEQLIKEREEHEKSEESWRNIFLILIFIIFIIMAVYSKPNDPQFSGQSHYDPR